MTLRGWNSFQYDTTGWTVSGRTAGTGQSGYASIQATAGVEGGGEYSWSPAIGHQIHGFCHKASAHTSASTFFRLENLGTNTVMRLSWGLAGQISVVNQASTTLGVSASGLINVNVENYIEVRWLPDPTVGEVEVRLNGDPTPVLLLTGQNTGTALADTVFIGGAGGDGTRNISAWYFVQVDATPPNDFLGHIRYGVLPVTGNGANSGLVGSDGNTVDNYLLVDDPAINHDSDSTYVQSGTVTDKDTYATADLPTTPLSIIAVCPLIIAKKMDAGSRAITALIRSGGTDYQGATEQFLSTSYVARREAFLTDPDTATAWDEAGINAAEFGLEVTT